MKDNRNYAQAHSPAHALKNYVFALADGLLVTIRAENEYAAARIAREQCC